MQFLDRFKYKHKFNKILPNRYRIKYCTLLYCIESISIAQLVYKHINNLSILLVSIKAICIRVRRHVGKFFTRIALMAFVFAHNTACYQFQIDPTRYYANTTELD